MDFAPIPGIIGRSRLLKKAEDGLRAGHLFLSAPAGYGKTILLQSLHTYLPDSHLLQLTQADQDGVILEQKIAAAIKQAAVILLDDVHVLRQSETAVTWLKERLKSLQPRWILAGRQDLFPPATLALYVKISRITQADLAFNAQEAQLLLPATTTELAQWQEQLEGWPLGYGLLQNLEGVVDPVLAAEKQLLDYLAEQVLSKLPKPLQEFMAATAVPPSFDAAMVASLVGSDQDTVKQQVQTLQRRNLYIYFDAETSSYRYHDLIRELLLRQLSPQRRNTLALAASKHLLNRGEELAAVEVTLDHQLYEEALRLILNKVGRNIVTRGYLRTYQRWFEQLPATLREAHPRFVSNYGYTLHVARIDYERAWVCLNKGVELARQQQKQSDLMLNLYRVALVFLAEGKNNAAHQILIELYQQDNSVLPDQTLMLSTLITGVEGYRCHFDLARRFYREAAALAAGSPDNHHGRLAPGNYAALILTPQGHFSEALQTLRQQRQELTESQDFQNLILCLRNINHIWHDVGNWPQLRANLQEINQLLEQVEVVPGQMLPALAYDRAMLYIGEGKFEDATELLQTTEAERSLSVSPLELGLLNQARVWLLRRQGRYAEAMKLAEETLTIDHEFPYYFGRVALEKDIAHFWQLLAEGKLDQFALSAETAALIPMRVRGELVRLRMLLAVCCWRQGDDRWRRLLQRCLDEGKRPFYRTLLTTRDPELAVEFWKILLVEGIEEGQMIEALLEINLMAPLLPLLAHREARVRHTMARLLAECGDEQAIPALEQAIKVEKDAPTRKKLRTAVIQLEQTPPPPLSIKLMGEFTVWRDKQLLTANDFSRPIVARLLQHLALHKGQPIPRERLLGDLWSDTDPERAARSLRTVSSLLRGVLEPYMRRRGPNRYLAVAGDVITFDPDSTVFTDVQTFRQHINQGLLLDDPLADGIKFLAALESYGPLLPNLPYADWLIVPRQQLLDMFIEGTLKLSRLYLERRMWAECQHWIRKTLTLAPWSEQGWQVLMQAYARQGQRALALKAYDEAVIALRDELAIAPSELTRWLYSKLTKGETI